MSIRKLRAGRVPTVTASQFVGEYGTIFWNESTGELRLSNGSTLGGLAIPLTLATSSIAGAVKPGTGFTIDGTGLLSLNAGPMFELDDNDVFQLKPGTTDVIGGIRPGPGVTITSDGILTIDPAGLEFTFGDLTSTTGTYAVGHPKAGDDYALLKSVNAEEDVIIASNGSTGVVKVIGDFSVRHTNGDIDSVLTEEPIFRITSDGQIRMLVPAADPLLGALEIVGNDSGVAHPPNQTGVILHVTGNSGLVSRNYFDAANNYALLVGRRYNGTAADTTKVLSGELMLRIAGQASNDTGFETFGPAQIDWVATEDQGPTNQGGEIRIRATPNGSSASAGIIQVAAFNATTGVTATKFNGPLTGLRTHPVRNAGNVTGTTMVVDFSTDDIVHCTFTDAFTIDFSNHTIGRVITVIATNTSAGDTDIITTGISAVNMQGDNTLTVNQQTTAIITYYCTTGLDTGVFASAVYA